MKAFWTWLRGLFRRKAKAPVNPIPPVPSAPSAPSAPPAAPRPAPPAPGAPPSPTSPIVSGDSGPASGTGTATPLGTYPALEAPSFFDDFSQGHLDTSKWIASDWAAPGGGHFSPSQLSFDQGMLRIRLTQSLQPDGSIVSLGGELQSRQKFGFGIYQWVMRASSTSSRPDTHGSAISGQISSCFLFQKDAGYTEIDAPEIEGDNPSQLSWTTWTDDKTREYTATTAPFAPEVDFHFYTAIWVPQGISFWVDGVHQITHTHMIPHAPAYIMLNHWGTNSQGWGGTASPGLDRYMFVKSVRYTPYTPA